MPQSTERPTAEPNASVDAAATFITRWANSSSAERANYQLFLSELCDLLQVPRPDPTRGDDRDNAYVFEKTVTFDHADGTHSTGRIDLYKRGSFVLEAKQGSDAATDGLGLFFDSASRARRGTAVRGTAGWDAAMVKARNQADRYVHALPPEEGNPPFLLVVDVGHVIEIYADFSRLGKTYIPFPDARSHRISLEQLADPDRRAQLAAIWTDPLSLDPSRRSAKVTRDVAADLAALARSLEASGFGTHQVSEFLMRMLFTLFAEDAKLIADNAFTEMLRQCKGHEDRFPILVAGVWKEMDRGADLSLVLKTKILRFNGGLFKRTDALPLTADQLALLTVAAEKDWSDVEPAIFGTLLERALDTRERHKLGAHYTPRAYVERLVLPTVIEPLREQWEAAKAAAFTLAFQNKNAEARDQLHAFLRTLCNTTVLDPACGSGNFLYVTMEHMKRLEGEVRDALSQLGETQLPIEFGGLTVDPHQFLGLEINPRARDIADVVLWIGYLKWHLRTLGHPPEPPILRKYDNIKCQDAVLAYDRKELVADETGKPVTRWDGRTMKVSPVTGEEIPDETARVPDFTYRNPSESLWPPCDFVVGNPPFLGARTIRLGLGDGYLQALRSVYSAIPEHADFVLYWWYKAARLLVDGAIKRFGLITTKSISQSFSRPILDRFLNGPTPISLIYAVPNHPWVDSSEGADVRIAITCCVPGHANGVVQRVVAERVGQHGETEVEVSSERGKINSGLTVGVELPSSGWLSANHGLSCVGYQLSGQGFSLAPAEALALSVDPSNRKFLHPLLSGRDIAQQNRRHMAIDLFGLSVEEARAACPGLFQWVLEHVKPERDQNNRRAVREKWWLYGEQRSTFRPALRGLPTIFATPITAKHRYFIVVPSDTICDSTCVMFAVGDHSYLAVMSGRFHIVWAVRAGGRLGVGDDPRYLKAECFDKFPFPNIDAIQKERLFRLGSELDAHRKRQQSAHPDLTITDMYNVLQKLRKNEPLTPKDKIIHEHGLVSVLKQIHDDLDAAVAEAYGWPVNLSDEEILQRLVALNAERAEEEKRGIVRWLRPEFQNPSGAAATQGALELKASEPVAIKPAKKQPWPKELAQQVAAVRSALASRRMPVTAAELAKGFAGARREKIAELLAALAALGQARPLDDGRFAA